jgi:hypothetical protein
VNSHESLLIVINREIDIAVVGGEIWWFKKTLSIEDFVYDELSLIISSHPFAKKKKLTKKTYTV